VRHHAERPCEEVKSDDGVMMLRGARLTALSVRRHQPQQRALTVLALSRSRLLAPPVIWQQRRGAAMFIGRLVRGALKIRYLLLGGALGGGMTLQKSYEQWKENLPDLKWLEQYLPPPEKIDAFRENLIKVTGNLKDAFEVNPKLKELGEQKYQNLREWFDRRLEEAIEATAKEEEHGFSDNFLRIPVAKNNGGTAAAPSENLTTRLERMQDELMQNQLKYQKQVDRLEKENRELRRQLLLRKTGVPPKKVKKSLIDMYSEVRAKSIHSGANLVNINVYIHFIFRSITEKLNDLKIFIKYFWPCEMMQSTVQSKSKEDEFAQALLLYIAHALI